MYKNGGKYLYYRQNVNVKYHLFHQVIVFRQYSRSGADTVGKEEPEEVFSDTGAEEPGMVRLFINIGKKDRAKPGDILGALAGESGIPGKVVGTIDMYDKYTFVEVPTEYAREIINSVNHTKIKGKSVAVEPANQK